MSEDLPTLERPAIIISGIPAGGKEPGAPAANLNSADLKGMEGLLSWIG
jgi:hypothetical protein